MDHSRRLYVGTVGEGLWRSDDLGESFVRLANGIFIEADVRALAVDPKNSDVIYAGTNCGLYKSLDAGGSWSLLDTGYPGGWPGATPYTVWSVAISPVDSNIVFAGLCPSAILRSLDGGTSWKQLDANLAPECGVILHPRVTCIVFDPDDATTLWAGVEIDGIRRSNDLGETWQSLGDGLSSADIHALCIIPGVPRRTIAATNNDLNVSYDEGGSWAPCGVKSIFDWGYCRGIVQKAGDPEILFQGNGNGPPGYSGAIQVSRDGGKYWSKADLPHPPNSTVWTFAVSTADPSLIVASTVSGYLYISFDSGETWTKPLREFGEIRSLALV